MALLKGLSRFACSKLLRDVTKNTNINTSGMATITAGKKGPVMEKLKMEVETDATRLVKFVCGSDISKENPQDVEIKPDSEYPDWLWDIRKERAPPVHDLEPGTKQYWRRMRTEQLKEKAKVRKINAF